MVSAYADGKYYGRAEGLEKGRAEGMEKGEAIGLEKGRTAERAVILENIVINSNKEGLPKKNISTITGLSLEQIIEILKRNGLE
jgi:flagellar biosynthesis/type III secretory pathway protein FliH